MPIVALGLNPGATRLTRSPVEPAWIARSVLDNFVGAIVAYLPNVVAAVLILVVAIALAGVVGTALERTMGDTPTGKVVRAVAPVLIMAIGTFMVLDQLQIAPQIVTITYAALIGGLFLAMALAFGLGGREIANRMLSDAYDRGRTSTGRFNRDQYAERDRARTERSYAASEPSATAGPAPTGARSGDGPATHPRSSR